jgi:hypothetical protein
MTIPSAAKDAFDSTAAGGASTAYQYFSSANLPAGTLVFYTRDGTATTKATAYAVAATLNGGATAWCVDSTGASKQESRAGAAWVTGDLFATNACK